ncbi:MAG: hypothetical protein EON59_11895 [Alphaproteobacteria bacterium]|nr:MAG: hypothetical protein EON59_11895 [Alphaproteobacteria bacterium]
MNTTPNAWNQYPLKDRILWSMVGWADEQARAFAAIAARRSGIHDAGVFFYPNCASNFGLRREAGQDNGYSVTLHLGRVEVVIDYRARSSRGAEKHEASHSE